MLPIYPSVAFVTLSMSQVGRWHHKEQKAWLPLKLSWHNVWLHITRPQQGRERERVEFEACKEQWTLWCCEFSHLVKWIYSKFLWSVQKRKGSWAPSNQFLHSSKTVEVSDLASGLYYHIRSVPFNHILAIGVRHLEYGWGVKSLLYAVFHQPDFLHCAFTYKTSANRRKLSLLAQIPRKRWREFVKPTCCKVLIS